MKYLASILALFALSWPAAAQVTIEGEKEYAPHSLVKLKAVGASPDAGLDWTVHPMDSVDRADTDQNLCQFAAAPGTYTVYLTVYTITDGKFKIEKASHKVTVRSCHGPDPGPTPPNPPPNPTPPDGHGTHDPANALGRIRFGSAGCTATVIYPRMGDGRWLLLTAAHCVRGVGQKGTYTPRSGGPTVPIEVVVLERDPDVCWCVTEQPVEHLAYAKLARENPAPGTKIWHAGFGVDTPGNREEGEIASAENGEGQLRMILSVSSGDSGGGIFRADTNEVVSTVCCTSGMARRVSMWGGSTAQCNRLRPRATSLDGGDMVWTPVPIPIRHDTGDPDGGWTPVPIPVRPEPTATVSAEPREFCATQDEDRPWELSLRVRDLEREVQSLRAELAELKTKMCRCGPDCPCPPGVCPDCPTPAPMPDPPVKVPVNRPTRPMPDDGRDWVWMLGSHGEYTWVTYDPPVASAPALPTPAPVPTPSPVPMPAPMPVPAPGGCPGGVCPTCPNGRCQPAWR